MEPFEERVLNLDPEYIYNRIKIDKYKRQQSVPIDEIFPILKEICSCGCGKKLTGRRRRWATNDCMYFAQSVWAIITGRSDVISKFLKLKFTHWACCNCGVIDLYKEYKNGLSVSAIHKDHIIAVQNGGGGCWLSNYQLLCDECHKKKTKIDCKHK